MPTNAQPARIFFRNDDSILRLRRARGVTLVEVMIAAMIFTAMSMSVSALFLQNNRMSMRLRYRTNATNAALNILEQIRVLDFDSLNTLYSSSSPVAVTGAYVRVLMADPNAPNNTALAAPDPANATTPGFGADKVPLNYQKIDIVVNVRDDVIKNATWTAPTIGLPLESSASSTRMPMRYWLTLKYNESISGDATITAKGQVFEIILVYQWRPPGQTTGAFWESGTVRAVVPNPTPKSTGT